MADVIIQQHYINSGLGGGGMYLTGQYIRVIGNGPLVRAELWTAQAPGGTFVGNPSGGPNLTGDGIVVSSGSFTNPRTCEGADMRSYTVGNIWPYATANLSINHPSCAIHACDLTITEVIVTNETALGAVNGAIALTATTSVGPVKYSLTPDFVYADGQDSPITGLANGNYIVFAKDTAGCVDQINVYVGIDYIYGVRWRMDYDKFSPENWKSRVDIEQRDYVGALEMTCGGAVPFKLEYNPEKNSQIISSTATCEFFVEVEGKFKAIQEGDDRQHILKKYIDKLDGAGFILEWVGYISPEFYEEPYLFEPYVITLQALDGLKELDNKAFIQDSGQPFDGRYNIIQIINACLKKLPIELPLRSCVNIYEERMLYGAGDDPLQQTVINVHNFYKDTCAEVMSKVIHPFAEAQLFQSLGAWWIHTGEQVGDSSYTYREFNTESAYVGNGTIPVRQTLGYPKHFTRMCFIEAAQRVRYTRPLGKVGIKHDLDKDNNMIDSGGFEIRDIDIATEFFKGWHVYPKQSGASSGLEFVDNGDSEGAFFFEIPNSDLQQNNELLTDAMPLNVDATEGNGNVYDNKGTVLNLKFQLYLYPNSSMDVPWIWFGWRFRYTDVDTGTFWDWQPTSGGPLSVQPTPNEEHINDIYVSNFYAWQTFEFKNFSVPGPLTAEHYTVQVIFDFHNHKGRDFQTFDELRAVPTLLNTATHAKPGKQYYLAIGDNTLAYELRNTREDEHEPEIIRPFDFVMPPAPGFYGNTLQWVLTETLNPDGNVPLLEKILIDNVSISLMSVRPVLNGPGIYLVEPPSSVLYEATITDRNESSLLVDVFAGDAPPIIGAEYIYNGYFTLNDGSKTERWFRFSVPDERQYLLNTYLLYLQATGGKSKRLLSGEGQADIQIGFIHTLVDVRDDRVYRFLRFSLEDKAGQYSFELEDTLITADGESPIRLGEFSNDFSDDFNV